MNTNKIIKITIYILKKCHHHLYITLDPIVLIIIIYLLERCII